MPAARDGGTGWALVPALAALVTVLAAVATPMAAVLLSSGADGIGALWTDPYILRILRFTLLQAALSTLLSLLLAIPVALALARQPRFFGRGLLIRLMAVPMGLPALVGALGLLGIWGRQGLVNKALLLLGLSEPVSIYGLSGILLAHAFFNMPLACRLLLNGLSRLPEEYWLVAANLGMNRPALFRHVEWPALKPILPGIAGLIFMLCATSFTLVLTLGGGPAATTLEVAIYQALRFDFDPGRAVGLAIMQILVTALLLGLLALTAPAQDAGWAAGRALKRPDGESVAARLVDGTILLLALAFVGLPLLSVVLSGLSADLVRLVSQPIFWQATATSLAMAALAALLSLLTAGAMVHGRQTISEIRKPSPAQRGVFHLFGAASSLVLLVPPVVLGTGAFLLLRRLGQVGTPQAAGIVVLINMLMALPFVLRILEPAYGVHRSRSARLAASLGITGWDRLRLIDGPALAGAFATAFAFAMALSLGDLGAVALFGSERFVTLPWLLFSRLGSYRTQDADGLALILGLICLALAAFGTLGQRAAKERR